MLLAYTFQCVVSYFSVWLQNYGAFLFLILVYMWCLLIVLCKDEQYFKLNRRCIVYLKCSFVFTQSISHTAPVS